jgi:hypothetical protein
MYKKSGNASRLVKHRPHFTRLGKVDSMVAGVRFPSDLPGVREFMTTDFTKL